MNPDNETHLIYVHPEPGAPYRVPGRVMSADDSLVVVRFWKRGPVTRAFTPDRVFLRPLKRQ